MNEKLKGLETFKADLKTEAGAEAIVRIEKAISNSGLDTEKERAWVDAWVLKNIPTWEDPQDEWDAVEMLRSFTGANEEYNFALDALWNAVDIPFRDYDDIAECYLIVYSYIVEAMFKDYDNEKGGEC